MGDTVVNQLLSKMDGVHSLNNILLIGMTNRLDLIDEALLRPGRFEVHIEIGLPDEQGRLEILTIHTRGLVENGYLADDVDLLNLASLTKNYSGAEIEGLVKIAASYAFERNIDMTHLKRADVAAIAQKGVDALTIYQADFMRGLSEMRPSFGVANDALEMHMLHGLIPYGPRWTDILEAAQMCIQQLIRSKHTRLITLLLHGDAGKAIKHVFTIILLY